MDPFAVQAIGDDDGRPRVSGDGPRPCTGGGAQAVAAPRERGWTLTSAARAMFIKGGPA